MQNYKNKKILIIEDSKSYTFIISETLKREGFNVQTADNGSDGVKLAIDNKPDLILLDITMSGMDGLETSKEIRKTYPSIPIIFLTNMSDDQHISRGMETANDYLIKADISAEGVVEKVKEKLGL